MNLKQTSDQTAEGQHESSMGSYNLHSSGMYDRVPTIISVDMCSSSAPFPSKIGASTVANALLPLVSEFDPPSPTLLFCPEGR
jgi:hypothetical protein